MNHCLTFVSVAIFAFACGEISASKSNDSGEVGGSPIDDRALELTPRLELIGLGDVFDALRVTDVRFSAELFLLPESDSEDAIGGDAIGVDFHFNGENALTRLQRRTLKLSRPGHYQLFVRIHPVGDGPSVSVGASVLDEDLVHDRLKGDSSEPVPSPDEPVPSPDEPVPSPDEPVPSPDDETDEEPVPSPDDGDDNEPFQNPPDAPESDPTASVDNDAPNADPSEPVPSEPVPSPDVPVPSPADDTTRSKGNLGDLNSADLSEALIVEAGEVVIIRSRRAFDFDAGAVVVHAESTELVVTWDVRNWLRTLLSDLVADGQIHRDALDPRSATGDARDSFYVDAP